MCSRYFDASERMQSEQPSDANQKVHSFAHCLMQVATLTMVLDYRAAHGSSQVSLGDHKRAVSNGESFHFLISILCMTLDVYTLGNPHWLTIQW